MTYKHIFMKLQCPVRTFELVSGLLFNTSRQSKMHFILHGEKKKVQHKNKYKTVYLVG